MAKIFIDGAETRRQIDKLAGKNRSMRRFCEERGLHPEALNNACIKGYGSPKIIQKYMTAGIPVILSERPVPCRIKRERNRVGTAEMPPAGVQISLGNIIPNAFETPEAKRIDAIKELTIRTLEAYIDELKKI